MGKRVTVLSSGTWGVTLARVLAKNQHDVIVWSPFEQDVRELSTTRKQPNLPGMVIPQSIVFTTDMKMACKERDMVLFATPSVYLRETAAKARSYLKEDQIIVDGAKGIEPDTLLTMTGVIQDELQKDGTHKGIRLAALSGPTHAEEVALDMPSSIIAASRDIAVAETVQDAFMNTCLRVYTNTDILGVELCGALKNIVALASGISAGLGYGDNSRAALITRGMVEITRLGLAMGCVEQTFSGLAGVGDLIVTATSRHSRNNHCGWLIGQGKTPEEAKREVGMVVEGINAIPAALQLAARYQVEMPIVEAVNAIVNENANPAEVALALMTRDRKTEDNRF